LISIFYGILSAFMWGAADFIGGIASKRTAAYRVIFLAEIAGLIPFTALALLTREPIPPVTDLLWGALASLTGLGGLTLLYRALADGRMTLAAPISALLAAVVPVLVALFTIGLPSTTTLIGFGTAFGAVWMISQPDPRELRFGVSDTSTSLSASLRLPLLAGIFFGFYFVLLDKATENAFYWVLASARLAGIVALGAYALVTRQPVLPPREVWFHSIVNGMIDIAGNAFFVLSAKTGRLDVAAVLSSLYPSSTVFLARVILKERTSRVQFIGIVLAFIAIILFTL
jgi:drug/metabolite transporter (DMT)-like permease